MARFRGTVQGNRKQASRLGSVKSGLLASINGWDSGINVRAFTRDGIDLFEVSLTGGSKNPEKRRVINTFDKWGLR